MPAVATIRTLSTVWHALRLTSFKCLNLNTKCLNELVYAELDNVLMAVYCTSAKRHKAIHHNSVSSNMSCIMRPKEINALWTENAVKHLLHYFKNAVNKFL